MAWTSARRWMPRRFSTWAMLVLFVLASPWVVRIGWAHLKYRQQAAAIAELGRLGVLVESEEATPIVIRRHLPVSIRRVWVRAVKVDVREHKATNETLALIGKLVGLSELDIPRGQFDETGVAHLRPCRELKRLNLADTPITSAQFLALLPQPNLEWVDLSKTKVDDGIMPALCEHKELKVLALRRTGITGKHLHLLDQLPVLNTLILSCNDIEDDEIAHLKVLACLKTLSLDGTGVDVNTVATLVKYGSVRFLSLGGPGINDDVLKLLESLPAIDLDLWNAPVTMEGVVRFVDPPRERHITLWGGQIEYRDLVERYPRVNRISIYTIPPTH